MKIIKVIHYLLHAFDTVNQIAQNKFYAIYILLKYGGYNNWSLQQIKHL